MTPRFEVGETVTVLVGSHAGDRALVQAVVWSERDRCHYFYLEQPPKKLSRGYRGGGRGAGTSRRTAGSRLHVRQVRASLLSGVRRDLPSAARSRSTLT
jgi:hypothetical protein